jgi:O-antigen ligase
MRYLTKTIEYGLYLLVFFLPWQTRWIIRPGLLNGGPWEYGSISLYGTDILLIILLTLFVVYSFLEGSNDQIPMINDQKNFKFKILNLKLISNFKFQISNLLIGGLVLVAIISIFFAPDKSLAVYKLAWLGLGIGLFWLVAQAGYDKVKLAWSLLLGLAVQASLGIWQFLNQAAFANKWLGLAWHRASELGAAVVETMGRDGLGERWLRAYGGLDHPNILGGALAVGALVLVGEMIRVEKKDKKFLIFNFKFLNQFQISNFKFQNIIKIIFWILLVFFAAALFFSFSRSAWLGLGTGLTALLARAVIKKDWLTQKVVLQTILVMGAAGFVLFFQYPNLVMTRLYSNERLEIKSTNERLESVKNSWQLIKSDWFIGTGVGNYSLVDYNAKLRKCETAKMRNYPSTGQAGENAKKECEEISSFVFQPAHNVFLLVWAETGILGLICFLGVIVYLIIFNFQFSIFKQFSIIKFLKPSLKIKNLKLKIGGNNENINSTINLSVIATLIILLCLDHWLWSLHFGALFFWLMLGMAAAREDKEFNLP